jgi:hypothetical protein
VFVYRKRHHKSHETDHLSWTVVAHMSDKKNMSGNGPRQEPGRASADLKPKKAAAHRQVIQDAARYNQPEQQTPAGGSSVLEFANNGGDDYESGKVSKRRGGKNDDDVQMVRDLDRWG